MRIRSAGPRGITPSGRVEWSRGSDAFACACGERLRSIDAFAWYGKPDRTPGKK